MIWPIADPTAPTVKPSSTGTLGPPSRLPTNSNGTAMAPAINVTTNHVNTRMLNTRQKLLRTNVNDRLIASVTGSRSNTISTGANDSAVYR